jgi:hypothetical protein
MHSKYCMGLKKTCHGAKVAMDKAMNTQGAAVKKFTKLVKG